MKNEENIYKSNLISKKILWILIIFYVFFIYISLPFFPTFITTLRSFIPKASLNFLSLALTILFFLMLSIWVYKKNYKSQEFFLIISPLLLLTFLSLNLEVWIERIHFVEYAFLGLLISRTVNVINLKGFFYSGCLVTMIGAVDEIIQWFLPNRFGDIRDVFMNSIGGLSGLWLGRFLFWDVKLLKKIHKKNKNFFPPKTLR